MKTDLSLDDIVKNGLCTGCGLCVAMSPPGSSMQMNANGFLRPRFLTDLSADVEKTITSICPGVNLKLQYTEGPVDDIWGPIIASRQGHATESRVRFAGSSGGVLTALCEHLLASRAVDGVIQVRALENDPTQNEVVLSRRPEETVEAAGSRYAPSAPVEILRHYLEREGRFAVVAKPCDIAAVRQWMHVDEKVRAKFPYLLSFFCAGVPSRRGAQEVVEKLGLNFDEVESFRYRGNGWPGEATAVSKTGESRSMSYAKSWGDILSRHVQFRCKICPDGTGEFADIVCADAWECDDKGYPLFDEREGQSIVLSRTRLGERLVHDAMSNAKIALQDLPVNAIFSMQPGQLGRKKRVLARLVAMGVAGRKVPRFQGLRLYPASQMNGIKDNLKNVIGTLRRILMRKDIF